MKICFNQAATMKNSTLESDLEYCEKYHYDLIELRLDKLHDYLTRHTLADQARNLIIDRVKSVGYLVDRKREGLRPDPLGAENDDLLRKFGRCLHLCYVNHTHIHTDITNNWGFLMV